MTTIEVAVNPSSPIGVATLSLAVFKSSPVNTGGLEGAAAVETELEADGWAGRFPVPAAFGAFGPTFGLPEVLFVPAGAGDDEAAAEPVGRGPLRLATGAAAPVTRFRIDLEG